MQLRPYQQEALDALYAWFREHPDPDEHPLLACPTGTGKSLIIAGLIRNALAAWPGQRILLLTHVKELVEQNAEKLLAMWPAAPLGVYSAGLGSKVAHMPITFAGVQSVARALPLFEPVDLILVDEVHLVSPDEESVYQKVLAYFKARRPRVRFVGLSATIYRLGLGMLTDGGVFTDVAYDITSRGAFNRLLDEGYLCPLISMRTSVQLDVSGVRRAGGDFVQGALQDAVNRDEVTRAAVAELVEAAAERNHWLIFASGIEHAQSIMEELRHHDVECAGVWSRGMSSGERDANIAAFKAGRVRALLTIGVLTTGFDFPPLDCIVLLRPTSSPVLHVQILGRGTRPLYADGFDLNSVEGRLDAMEHSSKQNCLVLDYSGNTLRLGPINDPRIPKMRGKGTGDIPVKVCDACGCLNHISARVCDNCQQEFSFDTKLTQTASTAELIVRDEPLVEVFDVGRMTYQVHVKPGSPPSLRVDYYCGMRRFSEWVCLGHVGSNVQHKARAWWRERSTVPPPETVPEAMPHVDALRRPRQIRVWLNVKNPRVLSAIFEESTS